MEGKKKTRSQLTREWWDAHPEAKIALSKRRKGSIASEKTKKKQSVTMLKFAKLHPEWVENCRQKAVGNKSNTGKILERRGKTLEEVHGKETADRMKADFITCFTCRERQKTNSGMDSKTYEVCYA